jgi:CheY-like chemotaxis protein
MEQKAHCIMLIDDDEADTYYHKIIIKETGLAKEVLIAENGVEALGMLKEESKRPDIIFVDINMPKMNGWEFLEAYNNLDIKGKKSIIVAMLTTSVNPSDRDKATKTYPNLVCGLYVKPLTPQILEELCGLNRDAG